MGQEGIVSNITNLIKDNLIIIVAMAGAAFLLLIMVVLLFWLVRRRSKAKQQAWTSEPYFASPEPPLPGKPLTPPAPDFETRGGLSTAPSFEPLRDIGPGTETEAAPPAFDAPAAPPVAPFSAPATPPASFGAPSAPPSAPFAAPPAPPFGTPATTPPAPSSAPSLPLGVPPTPPPPLSVPPAVPMEDLSAEETLVVQRGPRLRLLGLLVNRKQPSIRFDVDKATVAIGRGRTNAIVLEDPTVSRQHATIKLENNEFVLYDLGSANGTYVDGERVRDPVPLKDGAVVKFGEMEFTFKIMTLE